MEKRVLINRWLGSAAQAVPIYDEASVSSARQRVREAGERMGLSKVLVENVALIASELTHNQLSHARQGYFSVAPIERDGIRGLEAIAADLGPGIEKPDAAIRDKMASEGSLGAGLAAVCRIADEVEFDNRILEGTCIVVRKFESTTTAMPEIAIMGKPYPGEVISGDDAVVLTTESGFVAVVADGLGHGPEARVASNRAIEVLSQKSGMDLDELLVILNRELAGTRGCAINIMRFIRTGATLEYVSAGDVCAHLYHLRDAHFFTPTPLVIGTGHFQKQRIRVERAAVKPGSVLIMFTDGLKSRTTLKGELDVLRQPSIAIAQHLLENNSRPDDDALVCVVRFPRG
jgi:anti-sigma regulatory factor (Ser/Thr protein kinase)